MTIAGLCWLAGTAVAVHHQTTRPCPRPGIPLHDYPYRDRSTAVSAVSRVGILLKKSTREVEQLAAEPPPVVAATTEVTARDIESIRPLEGNQVQINRDRVETFSANDAAVEGEVRQEERGEEPVRINLYQLDRPRLQVDQCEISGVSLLLDDQGGWVLSQRGDQNRRGPAEDFVPTLHIP
jgi:hypothetical protein